jgi:hypothetical protein
LPTTRCRRCICVIGFSSSSTAAVLSTTCASGFVRRTLRLGLGPGERQLSPQTAAVSLQ